MKSAVCAVASCENPYLIEWIDYHLNLGFDKIFLYDNNAPDDNSVYDLLFTYISERTVDIVDYRGRKSFQLDAYNDCYKKYGGRFDWIAFIDLDEFITFGSQSAYHNINSFLGQFYDFDVIELNWMIFNDNGKVCKEDGGVLERFLKPMDFSHSMNRHVKCMVRTGKDMIFTRNPHCVDGILRICDDCLHPLDKSEPFKEPSFQNLYIRHYITKTLEEYVLCKMRRGAADSDSNSWKYNLYSFYRMNKRTREKRMLEKKFCSKKVVFLTDFALFLKSVGLGRIAAKMRI